jgi:hypothetical protein
LAPQSIPTTPSPSTPQFEQLHRDFNFFRIEASSLKNLEADAVTAIGTGHAVVEAIDDHRPVIG